MRVDLSTLVQELAPLALFAQEVKKLVAHHKHHKLAWRVLCFHMLDDLVDCGEDVGAFFNRASK